MTYIVAEPCIECKYTDCAAVCPVEAFHELPDRLLINPDTCIDCDACIPECPVEAIYSDMSIPAEYMDWLEKKRRSRKISDYQHESSCPARRRLFRSTLIDFLGTQASCLP